MVIKFLYHNLRPHTRYNVKLFCNYNVSEWCSDYYYKRLHFTTNDNIGEILDITIKSGGIYVTSKLKYLFLPHAYILVKDANNV